MNSLRIARAALRVRPATASASTFRPALPTMALRRGYADAATDKIKLNLSLPHQAVFKASDVIQVNIPAESGEMGVLANHVPAVEQLNAGVVTIMSEGGENKQWFVSGGFAVVQPNSELSINAVEAYALEDFSAESVKAQLAEAQKVAAGTGSEEDIAEAKVEIEVLETLQAALK